MLSYSELGFFQSPPKDRANAVSELSAISLSSGGFRCDEGGDGPYKKHTHTQQESKEVTSSAVVYRTCDYRPCGSPKGKCDRTHHAGYRAERPRPEIVTDRQRPKNHKTAVA